ncbi:MAG: aminotransferase class V-fold PLP-dependent enzyme [Rhodothermales bacterium]
MLDLRHHFHLPPEPKAVELRAFTHGLQPKSVPAMMTHFVADWQQRGVDAWNAVPNHWRPESGDPVGWWTLPSYLGDQFIAPLLHAPQGTCIMQPNVNWIVQALISAPEPVAARRKIVVTENAFPSVLHTVRQWQDVCGLDVVVLPATEAGFVDQDAVRSAIDDETAWVFLSHVGFTTGERLTGDFLHQVGEACHKHGALFAIDGYHATASIPTDVQALGVDVYFGGLLKEACGSSGNAYLYVRNGVELTPRLTGWFGDADPFGFQQHPQAHPEVRQRFLGGTTSVASHYHAVEGLRLFLDLGIDRMYADVMEKSGYAIERARAAGLTLRSPIHTERRSAMLLFDVPYADRLSAYLKQHRVYTDSRKGALLRMAPFVWNTQDDLDCAFDLIGEAVRSGHYLDASLSSVGGPVT